MTPAERRQIAARIRKHDRQRARERMARLQSLGYDPTWTTEQMFRRLRLVDPERARAFDVVLASVLQPTLTGTATEEFLPQLSEYPPLADSVHAVVAWALSDSWPDPTAAARHQSGRTGRHARVARINERLEKAHRCRKDPSAGFQQIQRTGGGVRQWRCTGCGAMVTL
jgi:hypothetical protein